MTNWHCPLCKAGGKPSGPRRGISALCVDHVDHLKATNRYWCNICKHVILPDDYAHHSHKCHRCARDALRTARQLASPPDHYVPVAVYARQVGTTTAQVRVWLRTGMHPAVCRVGRDWWVDPTVTINRPQRIRKRGKATAAARTTKPKPRWETTLRSLARYFGVAPATYRRALEEGRVQETATTITLVMAPRGRKKRQEALL